tara:strand:- start:330 stop:476 length:147 start_codon:yes stop_codon:yes gene_type:complete
MPKNRIGDITAKQQELEKKLASVHSTAIAAMVIGSVALLITLFHLAVS